MAEIFKFDPSKRKKKEKKPEEEKVRGNKPLDIGDGLRDFMSSRGEYDPADLMVKLLISGTMIHEKIKEIKRNTEGFSQEVFSEREERVRKYTNDQLINALAGSHSAEWHKYPALYRAIANEILERMEMITKDDK